MKKIFTLLLITSLVTIQTTEAQSSPVLVTNFNIDKDTRSGFLLTWAIANNEMISIFEIERSVNGKDFTTVTIYFATEKKGIENYTYSEKINSTNKVMYRLKMLSRGQSIYYSKTIVFQPKSENNNNIKIFGNPVTDNLTFSYTSTATKIVNLKAYDLKGKVLMSQKIKSPEGSNIMSFPLDETFKPGVYVLEVNNGTECQTAKFVKQ